MAPNIPDRWIPYFAYGKMIEGTRIICFKVPLRRTLQDKKPEITQIWDINTLLEKIPKLGAVIDLTNTSRYYDPYILKSAGVLHKKILMPGRIIPPEDKVTEFMDTVEEFLQKDDESLVGVHCTHGLNRTGYMVCRYLRDRMHWPAALAVEEFEKARGYKIERANYVADLLGKAPSSPDINKPTTIKPIGEVITKTVLTKNLLKKRYRSGSKIKIEDWRKRPEVSSTPEMSKDKLEYSSPLAYVEEVGGHTMRYSVKRNFRTQNYNKNIKTGGSSTESFDYRYDY